MFCPNCSREISAGKNFCPSCGLKLQTIIQALTQEQLPNQEGGKAVETTGQQPRSWQRALLPGLWVILLGIIISLLGKDMFALQAITDIGVIVAILGMGLLVYNGIGRSTNKSKPLPSSPTPQPTAQTIRLSGEPISITEHTTRELALPGGSDQQSTQEKDRVLR